jgi:ribosome-associated toxin RatA of RatAB toxin-antitoxin module
VTSDQPPFRHFKLCWTFKALRGARCRVSLVTEFELRSFLLQKLVERLLPATTADIISAFEARAHQLCDDLK